MSEKPPFVKGTFLLEKFPGKGGWTFARIPEIKPNKNTPFGWVRVRGSIDGFVLEKYKLMPMGDETLFLPVKAAIRKKIKKEAGDQVVIKLWLDEVISGIPEELQACFDLEQKSTLQAFLAHPEFERNAMINWIYDAKTEDQKAGRILELMKKFEQ